MGAERREWLGPGAMARRLGVTTKALRVYEREGLVVPHRAPSGWRLYGPAQVARLHQIIVLRDLGVPLKSIKALVGSQSRLREVLRLQRESLEAQRAKIDRAITLIDAAQRQLDQGRDLSLDDLATLTKETAVQQSSPIKAFEDRLVALVAERDPTGEAGRAVEALKQDIRSADVSGTMTEFKSMLAEAKLLKEIGDVESEAAKQLVRNLRARSANVRRPSGVQRDVVQGAYDAAHAEAEARSESLPFDLATLEFLKEVTKGMKQRGELA